MSKLRISFVAFLVIVASIPAVGLSASQDHGNVTIVSVQILNGTDTDGDGHYSDLQLEVRLSQEVESGYISADHVLVVKADGETLKRRDFPESESSMVVEINTGTLVHKEIDEPSTLTVHLVDDGVVSDSTLDTYDSNFSVEYNRLKTAVSRDEVTVGSVFYLSATSRCTGKLVKGYCFFESASVSGVEWEIVSSPENSTVNMTQADGMTSFVAWTPGTYEIVPVPPASNGEGDPVKVEVEQSGEFQLASHYAPILRYVRETEYFSTRYEAYVGNSKWGGLVGWAKCIRGCSLTMSDLQTSPEDDIELKGEVSDFLGYDDDYRATVYTSISQTKFRGEQYTAVTYWMFYIHDPKSGELIDSIAVHNSDTETVVILFDGREPRYIGASQHFGGTWMSWEKAPKAGNRPIIYPAVGAHSNYFVNTKNYSGDGILAQRQFIRRESTSTDYVRYADRTGADIVLNPEGAADRQYQLLHLTGDEIWANYRGSLSEDITARIPMQRGERWNNPGGWMESNLVRMVDQIEAHVKMRPLSFQSNQTHVRVQLWLSNYHAYGGLKPHTFWSVIEAKPAGDEWTDAARQILLVEPIPLSTGTLSQSQTLTAPRPDGQHSQWSIRIRILSHNPLKVNETEEYLAVEKTKQFEGTISSPETPQPELNDSTTSSPTGTVNRTSTPGFGFQVAGIALIFFVLLSRRFRS